MKERFIDKKFRKETLIIISQADKIVADYMKQGFTLTLRQLYYQFVARGLLENSQKNYNRLGGIISDARLAGLIDWSGLEDRTRSLESLAHWGDPSRIVSACAQQYREDLWVGQDYRPEVWIEKEALAGVIQGVCEENRVPYFACRGYASQSAQYEASKRFLKTFNAKQIPIVFHLGDHDPSGIDMTRENEEKIALLVGRRIKVVRLALNMEQVEEYNPPPNPAKDTDSRFEGYRLKYGDESWELDALDPNMIRDLIQKAIDQIKNSRKWDLAVRHEQANQRDLERVSDRWDEVVEYVK